MSDSAPGSAAAADEAAEAAATPPGPELRIGRITVFPIKSLDGVEVDAAAVLPSGALAWDRRFALFGPDGAVVNGKREPRVHRVAAEFDLSGECVTVGPRATGNGEAGQPGPGSRTFSLHDDREELEAFLSRMLARPVRLREDQRTGFPDDLDAPGPTVITAATVATVAGWFDLPPDEVRRRFRTNFELTAQGTGTAEPFAEDRLVPEPGEEIEFWAGEGRFVGARACQRCVVPTRDSRTGAALRGFQKEFADLRRRNLPPYAPKSGFDHFFRLAVNTRPLGRSRGGGNGGVVRVGDAVRIIGPRPEMEPAERSGAEEPESRRSGRTGSSGSRSRRRR
ncbi:MOSC domain-containing protein [Alienimonas sp. DA493]|uniref:MOSC domain-containing protein n=1 Tax=Alienimonas sp. DA493 TaxID=3373605 RepID=UPI0037544C9B